MKQACIGRWAVTRGFPDRAWRNSDATLPAGCHHAAGAGARGVAFEFRAKAPIGHKRAWDVSFFCWKPDDGFVPRVHARSLISWGSAIHGGFGLRRFDGVVLDGGLQHHWCYMADHEDRRRIAAKGSSWSRGGILGVALACFRYSLATPLVSNRILRSGSIFLRSSTFHPCHILSMALVALIWWKLRHLPTDADRLVWVPFVSTIALFALGFAGLAYSFYPFIVPEAITIYEAASAPDSLWIILVEHWWFSLQLSPIRRCPYWIFPRQSQKPELRLRSLAHIFVSRDLVENKTPSRQAGGGFAGRTQISVVENSGYCRIGHVGLVVPDIAGVDDLLQLFALDRLCEASTTHLPIPTGFCETEPIRVPSMMASSCVLPES